MHSFYHKTWSQQNRILLFNGLILMTSLLAIIFLAAYFKVYGLFFLAALLLLSFESFIDVPIGKRKGVFVYYSPLLFTTREKDKRIEIHGGTLFDYYYALHGERSSSGSKKAIVGYYLQGLLNLIDSLDAEKDAATRISASTYILSERTALRMGFRKVKPDYRQSFMVLLNFLPLLLSHSYAARRISVPQVFRVKTYEARLKDLKNNQLLIREVKNRLDKSSDA